MTLRRITLDCVDSTNAEAWRRRDAGETGEFVVLADEQLAGRGRRGRAWASMGGRGLYASLLIRPGAVDRGGMLFGLGAALALTEAIDDVGAPRASIKWPNDVEIDGRKVAGILVEARDVGTLDAAHVIGVGVNLSHRAEDFPDDIRDRATSLSIASGRAVDRDRLLDAFLDRVWPWIDRVKEGRLDELDGPYAERDALRGKRVTLEVSGERVTGEVLSISPARGLRLRLDDGEERELAPEWVSEVRRVHSHHDGGVIR